MIQRAQGFILVFQGFAGQLMNTDPMRKRMESALDQADTWLDDARKQASHWQTTEVIEDVAFALCNACQQLFVSGAVRFCILSTGSPQVLAPHVADNVYRIGVEALTNTLQHAMASRVEVEVAYEDGRFRLCVRDDGCGLNSHSLPLSGNRRFVGLQGMRRAAVRIGGRFRIWSRSAAGTEIEVVVPAPKAYRYAGFLPCSMSGALGRSRLC